MAGIQIKEAAQQDAEKAQEKKRQLESAPAFMKALADEASPFPGLLGVSAMELPLESHAAFLGDPRFSRPANNTQKAGMVTELQQAYGNQYVQRLVESMKVQAKLTVSSPGDEYEREADRVADAITRASASSIQRQVPEEEEPGEEEEEPIQTKLTSDIQVQRQAEEPEEEEEGEEPIQTKLTNDIRVQRQAEEPEEEEEEEPIQTKKAGRQTPLISSSLQSRINSLKGGGQPLPESTRKYFEPRFGSSFNNVRIHNDPQAANIAKSINAKAFTTGKDIVFGAGQYSPENSEGERLLAHELTHVVQQDLSTVRGGEISKPNEPAEAEAQRVREAVSCDCQVLPIKASAAQVSRQRSGTKGPARPASGGRVRSGGTSQRRNAAADKLREKLKTQVTKEGGITLAIYCARGVGDRSIFEGAANRFASDHDAVGMTGGRLKIPQAMTISIKASVGDLVKVTTERVAALLKATGAANPPVKVKTLAIFTHGDTKPYKRLQAGRRGGNIWVSGLERWAEVFAPYLAHDVKVILYACLVSKGGKMSFAEQLRLTLTQLMAKHIKVGQVAAPEVWGHTTLGHTTANPTLVGFYAAGSKDLLDWLAREMLKDALRWAQKKAEDAGITIKTRQDWADWPWPKLKWKEKALISYLRVYWRPILLGCMKAPQKIGGRWVGGEKLDLKLEKFIRDIPFRPSFQTVYHDVAIGNVPDRVEKTYKIVWAWLMTKVGDLRKIKNIEGGLIKGLGRNWCAQVRPK